MGRRGDRDPVIERLRARNEWKFAGVLLQADRALAVAWWTLLVLRGLLPALFAIAMGGLVGEERGQQSARSEEHTSELQSRLHLVCRLLLEKKKKPRYRARESRAACALDCWLHSPA